MGLGRPSGRWCSRPPPARAPSRARLRFRCARRGRRPLYHRPRFAGPRPRRGAGGPPSRPPGPPPRSSRRLYLRRPRRAPEKGRAPRPAAGRARPPAGPRRRASSVGFTSLARPLYVYPRPLRGGAQPDCAEAGASPIALGRLTGFDRPARGRLAEGHSSGPAGCTLHPRTHARTQAAGRDSGPPRSGNL